MSALRKLIANWPQKLMALVIAFVGWAFMINAEDPVETHIATVPLKVEAGTEFGVDLLGAQNVTATLRGPRRSLDMVREGVVPVTATLRLPVPMAEGTHRCPVALRGVPAGVDARQITPAEVDCMITRLARKTVPVRVRLTGAAPAGIYFGDLVYQPQEVEVVGPKEAIDAVDHVRSIVDRSDVVNNPTVETFVRAMDSSGGTIDTRGVSITPPRITVSVPAQDRASKTVPVQVSRIGSPATGCRLVEMSAEPSSVEIRGLPDALEGLKSIDVGPVDLNGRSESFEESLPLDVPEGLSPRNVSSVTVRVTIRRTAPGE